MIRVPWYRLLAGGGVLCRGVERSVRLVRSRLRAPSPSRAEETEHIAAVVRRLAVLLRAGVAPGNAWGYLAATGSSAVVGLISRRVSAGDTVPDAIVGCVESSFGPAESRGNHGRSARPRRSDSANTNVWRAVAAAWFVAESAGSSLAPTLDELAATLQRVGALHRAVDSALAGPLATARLIGWLPVVAVGVSTGIGFNTLGVLFGTAPGLAVLGAATVLSVLAVVWTRSIVAGARPAAVIPGLDAQLIAIGLGGGGSMAAALALAATGVRLARPDSQRGGFAPERDEGISGVLRLSELAGVPAAALLNAEADQARRDFRTTAERRAAALESKLLLPMGVCVLPAFMLLGVAPIMFSVFTATLGGL